MNKFLISILFCALCFSSMNAQIMENLPILSHAISGDNKKKDIYKGQVVKKKKTGMTFISYKDGSIYVGDVSDGIPNGIGTLFAPIGKNINGCLDATIYIGHF